MTSPTYTRSTDGNDADNGTTWALAKASLDNVDGMSFIDDAGGVNYVSASHSESTAANVTISLSGTYAAPSQLLCVDDTGDPAPPTTLATTAVVSVSGASDIGIHGAGYIYGITFETGNTGTADLTIAYLDENYLVFDHCVLSVRSGGSTSQLNVGATSVSNESTAILLETDINFAGNGNSIIMNQGRFEWIGGSLLTSVTLANLVDITSRGSTVLLQGLDLTNAGTSLNLFSTTIASIGHYVARDIKMASGWSGSVGATPLSPMCRIEAYNVSGADANYEVCIKTMFGTLVQDDALYRAPGLGASSWMYNGSTQVVGISHRYSTTADAEFPAMCFEGIELTGMNVTVDPTTSHVVECYFTTPGQADFTPLSNKDIGIRVRYAGSSGSPASVGITDIMTVLATESDQSADSTGDWDDALGAWVSSTAYSVGAVVRPTTRNGKTYYCSAAGTSHSSEPTWSTTDGAETSEGGGTVKWRTMHRQKMSVTIDATSGKIRERGWVSIVPVMYLASAVAWVDPIASITSS